MDDLPRVIDRYRLESRLGAGGMGVVFRAVDLPANQLVAVKLLRPEYQSHEAAVRFNREMRNTARLTHPNVVKVLDVGKTKEGELYFVMELLGGDSLSEVLRREQRLSAERAVNLGVQVCAALQVAHAAGIIHRDIKPANLVLVPRAGQRELVKVLDFGIARSLGEETELTRTGHVVGTTEYLAPEQILGQQYDGRADLYALGVTLFRALTGTPLFPNATDSASLLYHQVNARPDLLTERAPGAGISPLLERVVLRCLRKDPAERFQSAAELAAALEAASQGVAVVDDLELERAAFRRCAVCEFDNSRFSVECTQCGARLDTPAQRLFMQQLLAATRPTAVARPADPEPAAHDRKALTGAARGTALPEFVAPAPSTGPLERVKALLPLLAFVGVLVGLASFALRAPAFPDLSLSVDAERTVKISQARGGKDQLVVALIKPGDPVSEKCVMLLKERIKTNERKAAFAAVVFTDPAGAEAFRLSHDLPYPVYSLDPPQNPVEFNSLVKTVGGYRSRFSGGTVLVVDSKQRMVSKVDGRELENLDDLFEKL